MKYSHHIATNLWKIHSYGEHCGCDGYIEFNEGDYVMARIRPERYSKHSFKKLHARAIGSFRILHKLGPNAFYLELSSDLKFSLVFNIAGLFSYRGTFEPPIVHAGVPTGCTTSSSMSVPVLSPLPSSSSDHIEHIITDEIVSSAHDGFQRFLVKWWDRPDQMLLRFTRMSYTTLIQIS